MASFGAGQRWPASTASAPAERLERGDLLIFDPSPIPGPIAGDRSFLCEQRLHDHAARQIGYDPHLDRVYGFARRDAAQGQRLRDVLVRCAAQATAWLAQAMPAYAAASELAQVAFHPEEEATRKLRQLDRNDLLHIDAAWPGPSRGRRLLRLYMNLHPTDPRVWQTSLTFAEVIARYGAEVGLAPTPSSPWWRPLRHGLLRLLQSQHSSESSFDAFVQRLHDFLKSNEHFQERAPKKCWRFPPGSSWLVFTDGICHAELRGRCVLEFAFLIADEGLACPELSPNSLFLQAHARFQGLKAA